MEISDKQYARLERAYADCAEAVHWAYRHWALDYGIESTLKDTMGVDVSNTLCELVRSVEALLREESGLPKPLLALREEDHDMDNY